MIAQPAENDFFYVVTQGDQRKKKKKKQQGGNGVASSLSIKYLESVDESTISQEFFCHPSSALIPPCQCKWCAHPPSGKVYMDPAPNSASVNKCHYL